MIEAPQGTDSTVSGVGAADIEAVTRQLGRVPRGMVAVGHRCPCGQPDVVVTSPRLDDGTPFPTVYYLTCPRAAAAIGTMEAQGEMRRMQERLDADPVLASAYAAAHEAYLCDRAALGSVAEIDGISAGGMPDRVKCLHVLAAHSLVAGPGVNPLGDEVLDALHDYWRAGRCAEEDAS